MKGETRRPGDEPPFAEHANEEFYFAEKEHALVERYEVRISQGRTGSARSAKGQLSQVFRTIR